MAAGLALTGCAGAQTVSPPAPPGAVRAPEAAACGARELRAVFRGFHPTGTSLAGAVVVAGAGDRDCWLAGGPESIGLLDETGQAVAVKQRSLVQPATPGFIRLRPGVALPTFGAPPAQGSAWLSVTWSNWCVAESPEVSSLVVVLPGGGAVAAPLDPTLPRWAAGPPVPRCSDPRAETTVSYGRFQAPAA